MYCIAAANNIVKKSSFTIDYTRCVFQGEITVNPQILQSDPKYLTLKSTKTNVKVKPKELTKSLINNKWKVISCLQDETKKERYYVTYLSTEAGKLLKVINELTKLV